VLFLGGMTLDRVNSRTHSDRSITRQTCMADFALRPKSRSAGTVAVVTSFICDALCKTWRHLQSRSKKVRVTERRVPELIPVLGSQPAGDVSDKPGGKLPLLSAKPLVTPATLKRAATSFAAWWTEAQWVWAVCLRLLPDSVATAIWTRAFCAWVQSANHSATEPPKAEYVIKTGQATSDGDQCYNSVCFAIFIRSVSHAF